MKSIRVHQFGDPDVLRLEDIPDPAPGPGQVVVRLKAIGVNPVDVSIRTGAYRATVSPPYTPGSDGAGVVEAVGAEVRGLRIGDRVYITGTTSPGFTGAYAELALCREQQVHPLVEALSFAQGATIHVPYGTAYRAIVQRAAARAGETVLVHGASGGVGVASTQLARSFGLRVIGTSGSEAGRRLVEEQGAHHVLDHGQKEHLDEILKLTAGRGVDLILEMAAHQNLGDDLSVIAPGGRVVVIGCRGTVTVNPRETMMREASILGMHMGNVSPADGKAIWAGLEAGFSQRTLWPVIGREYPLEQAAQAQKDLMEKKACGKLVLIPG